ncbi:MAG: HPr family phosphocarrier protein [Treponema sp.]|nr:HPr family phosphocarrier protein [Treponema sp.]
MYAKKTMLINKSGLHARPGSLFTREAKKYSSDITVTKLDEGGAAVKSCSAKSIALVMAMMLKKDTHIEISAQGDDEQSAVDSLVALIDAGLNE